LLERLQAGHAFEGLEEDLKLAGLKRFGSEDVKVEVNAKRCKVTVKEEEVDGTVVLEIQDD
jgi:hypothetical protein